VISKFICRISFINVNKKRFTSRLQKRQFKNGNLVHRFRCNCSLLLVEKLGFLDIIRKDAFWKQ